MFIKKTFCFIFLFLLVGGLVLPVFSVSAAKTILINCFDRPIGDCAGCFGDNCCNVQGGEECCDIYCGDMKTYTMPVGMICLCPHDSIQCQPGDPGYPDCPFEEGIIDRAANWIFYLGVIIAPLFILIGAFMFWTAGGDFKKADGAKKVIIYAMIGLALAMCTKLIYHVIRFLIG